jgi:copper chaperone
MYINLIKKNKSQKSFTLNLHVKETLFSYFSILFMTFLCISTLIQNASADPSKVSKEDRIVCDSNAIKTLKSNQILLHVKGMVCGMCVQGITKLLKDVKGIQSVNIDLPSGSVIVDLADGISTNDQALRTAITHAGYEVQDIHWPNNK